MILLGALLFGITPYASHAQVEKITDAQKRVQGYIDFFNDPTLLNAPDGNPYEFQFLDMYRWNVNRGVYKFTSNMYGYHDDTSQGIEFLKGRSPKFVSQGGTPGGDADAYFGCGISHPCKLYKTPHETLEYWNSRCFSFIALMEEYKKRVIDRAVALTADGSFGSSINEIEAIVKDAEAGTLALATSFEPHPCQAFFADLHFAFIEAGSTATQGTRENAMICAANWLLKAGVNPVSSDGSDKCLIKTLQSLTWKPPNCQGANCKGVTINMKQYNSYQTWIPYLKFYTKLPNSSERDGVDGLRTFMKAAEENIKALEKRLDDVSGTVAAEKLNAQASAKAELDKGSVIGLSLPLSDIKVEAFIGRVIQQILNVVGALGLAAFLWGGFRYMTAGGNAQRAEDARKVIIWSVLGLVVIFAAYAIVTFIIRAIAPGSL